MHKLSGVRQHQGIQFASVQKRTVCPGVSILLTVCALHCPFLLCGSSTWILRCNKYCSYNL